MYTHHQPPARFCFSVPPLHQTHRRWVGEREPNQEWTNGMQGMCKPFHVFHSIAQTLRSRHPYSRTPMTHGAGPKTRCALIIDFYLIEASERRGCTAHRMKGDRAIPFSHTPCDLIVDPARSRKSSNMYTKIFSHRQTHTHTTTFKRSLSAYCSAEE